MGAPKPGDEVQVPFGDRIVRGVVRAVSGDRVHVDLDLDLGEVSATSLYRRSDLR